MQLWTDVPRVRNVRTVGKGDPWSAASLEEPMSLEKNLRTLELRMCMDWAWQGRASTQRQQTRGPPVNRTTNINTFNFHHGVDEEFLLSVEIDNG